MLNHELPQIDGVGESLGRNERIGGLLAELPRPGEMSDSDTQAALAAAQRVASILASRRGIAHPTPSESRDGQDSSKYMHLDLAAC